MGSIPLPKYRRHLFIDQEFLEGRSDEHPYDDASGARATLEDMEHERLNFGPYFEEHAVDDLRQIDAAVRSKELGYEHDEEAVSESLSRVYAALDARENENLF